MMEWQALWDGGLVGHPFKLSFPLCGNGLNKPLDSGLRRNDNGERIKWVAIPTLPSPFLPNS